MSSKLLSLLLFSLVLVPLRAQTNESDETMARVLKRLDALESENRRLSEELHSLKQELAASRLAAESAAPAQEVAAVPPQNAPSLDERLDVAEKRVTEQAQTKVETSQKFPLSLNGMLLFNAFSSSESALYTSRRCSKDPIVTGRPLASPSSACSFRALRCRVRGT